MQRCGKAGQALLNALERGAKCRKWALFLHNSGLNQTHVKTSLDGLNSLGFYGQGFLVSNSAVIKAPSKVKMLSRVAVVLACGLAASACSKWLSFEDDPRCTSCR